MAERQAVETWAALLEHGAADDPDAEWQAAQALGAVQLPEERDRAAAVLLVALGSGRAHALTRTHAVEALGKLGEVRAAPSLIAALRDPYPVARSYAARALGVLGDKMALTPLLAALHEDEFYGVRAEAVCAVMQLARLADAAQQQTVLEALVRQREAEAAQAREGSERVVAEIDRALTELGHDATLSPITRLIVQLRTLDPAEPDRQFEAARELGQTDVGEERERVIAELVKALDAPQALVRAHAAEALEKLAAGSAVDELIEQLGDPYQLARSYAARALGKLKDVRAIPALIAVLGGDKFFGVRAEAAEALRLLCPNDGTDQCRTARAALKQFRDEELKRNDEHSQRVLREIDLSLDQMAAAMNELLRLIEEDRDAEARQQAQAVKALIDQAQRERNEMGRLFVKTNRAQALV